MSFDILPYDVQGHILSFLSLSCGSKYMTLSKVWYQLLRDHLFSQYMYCSSLSGDNYLKRRGHATVPYGKNKLIIFAGYDGHVTNEQTNELMVYNLKKDSLKHLHKGSSKTSSDFPRARSFFPMCSIGNNEYAINGGYCNAISEKNLNDTWIISIEKDNHFKWKKVNQTGEIPPILDSHSLVHYNGYLVLFGGSQSKADEFQGFYHDIYVMKLETGEWKKLRLDKNSSSPGNITGHTAHIIEGTNQMILYGGQTSNGTQNQVWILHIILPQDSKYFEIYSKWEVVQPVSKLIPNPTLYHASVLHGDDLIVISGCKTWSNYTATNQFLAFNFKTRKWRDLSKLLIGKNTRLPYLYGHTLTVIGNKIALVGGWESTLGFQNKVLVFESVNDLTTPQTASAARPEKQKHNKNTGCKTQ